MRRRQRKGIATGGQFVYDFPVEQQQRQLDLLKAAGCRWLRFDFAVGNTGKPRDLAQRAHAQGFKVLGTIVWGRGRTITPYQAAATAAAEAPFVHALEPGNEVNLWSQFPATPSAYAAIYNAAKGGARTVSGIPVISSGLSPGPNVAGDLDPRAFLDHALAGGMEPDAIGWHPYCQPALPSFDFDWSTWTKMKRHWTFGEFPVWLTEVGAFTGTASHALSEPAQAEFITDVFDEALALGIRTPIFVYQGVDGGPNLGYDQDNYGLIRLDWSLKPAYAALDRAYR